MTDKEQKPETEKQEKQEKPKPKQQVLNKKEEAIANGRSLPLSRKQCQYICSFIKNKPIDSAINDLEQVIKFKKIVPFKGEIPHRKGKGIMSGRYPIKAAKIFISLLKGLKGNVILNQMELEKTRITLASASWASRPMRKGSVQGKRTHVRLAAKEVAK